MANRKISDLTALTATATGDLLPIVDISEAGAVDQNKKITIENLFKGIPGNVGIGTTGPTQKLTVEGSIAVNGGYLIPYNGATPTGYIGYGTSIGTTNDIAIRCDTGSILFGFSGTERARIDSSGRLLVGTSTARSSFFSASVPSDFLVETTGTGRVEAAFIRDESTNFGSGIVLGKSRGTSAGSNVIVASGDTLGVISFQGANGTNFTEGANIGAQVDGTPGANDMPGRLVFSTTADGAASSTERMRITQGGGVKASDTGSYVILSAPNSHEFVQTTAGSAAFHAYHTANTGLVYGYYFKFVNQNPNDTTAYVFTSVDNTNANIYTIWSNGTVATRSDAKFKKNIETTRNGYLEDLAQLRIVKYNWYNHEDDTPKELGFIAQEVEQVFPGLVSTAPDKDDQGNETGEVSKSIKTSVFTPMLVKALQEALERIETLEARLTAAGIA
jgi:hypothetical protein